MSEIVETIDGTTSMEQLAQDLADFIEAEEVEELGIEIKDSFEITSAKQAEFFAKKYLAVSKEIENAEEVAKIAIEEYTNKIERWKEKVINPKKYILQWWEVRLRAWAEAELANGKKKSKNVPVPGATLQFTKNVSVKYDEDKLMSYLKENFPEYIKKKINESVDKNKLKADGEFQKDGSLIIDEKVVPGMIQEIGPDKFKIAASKPKA